MSKKYEEIPLSLKLGEHERNGDLHTEWYFPCGCALHPEQYPHIHACCKEHDRNYEILERLEVSTKLLIVERDAFHEACSDKDGLVVDVEDKAWLEYWDEDIDLNQKAIARAKGE